MEEEDGRVAAASRSSTPQPEPTASVARRLGTHWIIFALLGIVILGGAYLLRSAPTARLDPHLRWSTAALARRFGILSHQHSSYCSLQPQSLTTLKSGSRLQGSCCTHMDFHRYTEQVRGLRDYASVPEVPKDPYDIPVGLAKELTAHQALQLSGSRQATYDRATKMSSEHGPCCCHCWRWTAFEGQAKFLISRRGFGAAQIADIWNLEDGCGGAGSVHRLAETPQGAWRIVPSTYYRA